MGGDEARCGTKQTEWQVQRHVGGGMAAAAQTAIPVAGAGRRPCGGRPTPTLLLPAPLVPLPLRGVKGPTCTTVAVMTRSPVIVMHGGRPQYRITMPVAGGGSARARQQQGRHQQQLEVSWRGSPHMGSHGCRDCLSLPLCMRACMQVGWQLGGYAGRGASCQPPHCAGMHRLPLTLPHALSNGSFAPAAPHSLQRKDPGRMRGRKSIT